MEIKIIDAIMGMGKTGSLINHINSSDEDTKFLYITPYLTEVERIIKMGVFQKKPFFVEK